MYRNILRIHDTQPASRQEMPRNATVQGNGGAHHAGGLLGTTEMVMVAATPVTLGDGKSLTLGLEDSADGIAFAPVPVSFRRTFSGGPRTWEPGDVLARLPVPSDCRARIRVVFGNDDPEASGSVDVLFDVQPR